MKCTVWLASTLALVLTAFAVAQEDGPRPDPRVEFLRERLELLEMRVELHAGLAELVAEEGEVQQHRLEQEMDVTRARLEAARAQRELSRRELDRMERLHEVGDVGASELDKAREHARAAEHQQDELRARLEALESEIHAVRVRAKRGALEAKLGVIEARMAAAEARFELRQHEHPPHRIRRSNAGRPFGTDPRFDPARPPRPDEERIAPDEESELDVDPDNVDFQTDRELDNLLPARSVGRPLSSPEDR